MISKYLNKKEKQINRRTLENINNDTYNNMIEHDARDIFDYIKNTLPNKTILLNILGFIIFFTLFVVTIPTILYKKGVYDILEVYLPNLDLIANLLSFHGGPENYNIFEYLYPPSPTNMYSFFSQSIINYMALLGLTYIIARETKLTNSIIRGWSLAFVMIMVTYLLPSQFISEIMEKLNTFLSIKTNINHNILWNVVVFIGFIITVGVIYFEKYLLETFRGSLINIGKYLINFPRKI